MKNQSQKIKLHRWSRKVFFAYAGKSSRKRRTRKKSFKTLKIKAYSGKHIKRRVEKFEIQAERLTIAPSAKERDKVLSAFEKIACFLRAPKQASFHGTILIKLQYVKIVDPTGCALLFSCVEMFQQLYPRVKIKLKYPKNMIDINGVKTIQPNHVFNHLKLYQQLGSQKAPTCHTMPPPMLTIWETRSFIGADSQLVGEILEKVGQKGGQKNPNISKSQRANIYKILIEAVNNCPEHAYDEAFMQENKLSYKKTRCLFAVTDNCLVVVVTDLGVGVRYTLENGKAKDSWNFFQRLITRRTNNYVDFASKDSNCLKGMINIKKINHKLKTRHVNHSNRGHGGNDLQKAIKELRGKLLIMSGKGSLELNASNPHDLQLTLKDFNEAFSGTLISMSIPLTGNNE